MEMEKEGSGAGGIILRCQVALPKYTTVYLCCTLAGIQVKRELLGEIGISNIFIFAALCEEVQLVLYESINTELLN